MHTGRIVLLPGLAADARMFAAHRARLSGLEVPPWIKPLEREDLAGYARRLAATIAPEPPFILGGASFGGMVAWEMARHCRPRALVLIGSAVARREIAWHLRFLTRIAPHLPLGGFRLAAPLGAWLAWPLGACTYADRRLIERVVRDAKPAFARWCAGAIASWTPAPAPGIPWLRLHGGSDPVIPGGRGAEHTDTIAGAAHFLDGCRARAVEHAVAALATRTG